MRFVCVTSSFSTWYPKGVVGVDPILGIHAITNDKFFDGRLAFPNPNPLPLSGLRTGNAEALAWRCMCV